MGLFEADGTLLQSTARPTIYNLKHCGARLPKPLQKPHREFTPAVCGYREHGRDGVACGSQYSAARSPLLAWHDRCAEAQVANLAREMTARSRFCRSGLRAMPNQGLTKLLWLREQGADFSGAVWLSTADFIALRSRGFSLRSQRLPCAPLPMIWLPIAWDEPWLAQWGRRKAIPAHLAERSNGWRHTFPHRGLKTGQTTGRNFRARPRPAPRLQQM